MPQSLSRILLHLIFSTKNREPWLTPEIRTELHPYLAVVLREKGCPALQVGGVEDHVHLLFGLSRTLTVAELVETVKTSSSKWMKTKGEAHRGFHWQTGYGAFSVSQSDSEAVVLYIQNQEQHHRKMTFQEEYRKFLLRYRVAYEETLCVGLNSPEDSLCPGPSPGACSGGVASAPTRGDAPG
jgi:putative transposase